VRGFAPPGGVFFVSSGGFLPSLVSGSLHSGLRLERVGQRLCSFGSDTVLSKAH